MREPTTPLLVVNRIEALKGIYPAWSNGDILTQLKNEGVSISCSTIGRIIKRLKASGHSRKHTTASDVRNKRGKRRLVMIMINLQDTMNIYPSLNYGRGKIAVFHRLIHRKGAKRAQRKRTEGEKLGRQEVEICKPHKLSTS